jgi:hypothetical protein
MEQALKQQIKLAKEDREKVVAERDEHAKKLVRIEGKEAQYQHELRNKEVQLDKLQD